MSINRTIRLSLLIVCLLGIAAVIATVIAVRSIDYDSYLKMAAGEVQRATGRKLSWDGGMKLKISLEPEVIINHLRFANAAWGKKRDMIDIDRVRVKMLLKPLLKGEIVVSSVVLDGIDLWLETDAGGKGNWLLVHRKYNGHLDRQRGNKSMPIVNLIAVQKSHIQFLNGQTGKKSEYKISFLLTNTANVRRPLKIVSDIIYKKHPIRVDGELGSVLQLLAGKPFPVALKGTSKKDNVSINGILNIAGHWGDFNFAAHASGRHLADFAALGGMRTSLNAPYDFAATVNNTPSGYSFKNITLKVGKSDMAGVASLDLVKAKTTISAHLSSDLLAVNELLLLPKKKTAPKAAPQESLFSTEKFTARLPKKINLSWSITGKKVLYDDLALHDVMAAGSLRDGKVVCDPLIFGIRYGGARPQSYGKVKSKIDISENNGQFKFSSSVKAYALPLGKLLHDLKIADELTDGRLDMTLDLHSRGQSVSSLMAGLNGQVSLDMAGGRINNSAIDYAGAGLIAKLLQNVNPFGKGEDSTGLKCGEVNFKFKDGKAVNDEGIGLETEKMNVIGGGSIDLKSEYLDFAIHPKPKRGIGLSTGTLAGLIRLQGPLAKPEINMDKIGAAKGAASVGMAMITGGLSIIGEVILSKITADTSPCKTVRESQ